MTPAAVPGAVLASGTAPAVGVTLDRRPGPMFLLALAAELWHD